jgi:ribose transport system ATP-binding protein
MSTPRLSISGLYKSFTTPVLSGVNLDIHAGEIHALIGENGAGKSTLMNILSGLLTYDDGSFLLDGSPYQPRKARDAFNAGISLAAQELSLVDTLSIAENIGLRRLPQNRTVIKRSKLLAKARQLIELLGLDEQDPDLPVSKISLGHRQLVELAKAMTIDNRLLILDEPTAALSEPQAQRLHDVIRDLAGLGTSIIYISHRLEDVRAVADTISILRDGQVVSSAKAESFTIENMISQMSGRESTQTNDSIYFVAENDPVFKVEQLTNKDLPHPITFSCQRGELFGIAGLAGSGQPELLEAMFGLSPALSGAVSCYVDNDWVKVKTPRHAVDMNIGFLPEDRKTQGIFAGHTLGLNMTLPGLQRHTNKTGIVNHEEVNRATKRLLDELAVKCSGPQQNIELLSGGNQQKVLVGRWLHNNSDIFLLNEPTRGVDIHTKHALHALFKELAERGKTMVIVSSEIEELMTLCNRILVLSNRMPVKIFARNELDYNAILEAAFSEYTNNNIRPIH